MQIVIKGIYYFNQDAQNIFIPHFSGCLSFVDCTCFLKMDDLVKYFDDEYINKVKYFFIEYLGVKYYNAEFSNQFIKNWTLIGNKSNLEYSFF